MRLTVLGSSASYAGPGQACSGYLVETGDARVVFDLGSGALSNLGTLLDPATVDGIFITHKHPDHFLDLYALQALLRYAPGGPAEPVRLWMPDDLFDTMKCLLSDRGAREFDEAFVVHPHDPSEPVAFGDLEVASHPVPHTDPTYALSATCGGTRVVYTADTSFDGAVTALAQGADLLLAEATLPEKYEGAAPHLTPKQAGQLARDAGVERLVLTHLWPTQDRETARTQAAETFGAPVDLAAELASFDIPRREGA
jgi:ribonuclease BN (tRNA processing enzyme)